MKQLFLFLFFMLVTSEALATTYYISPSGLDSRSCATAQNIATPKQTLTNFIQQCGPAGSNVFVAGDTLFLRGGTYSERINMNNLHFPTGVSWTNKVTISAYPGNCGFGGAGCEVPRFFMVGGGPLWIITSALADPLRYVDFHGLTVDCSALVDQNECIAVGGGGAGNRYPDHLRWSSCHVFGGAAVGPTNRQNLFNGWGGHPNTGLADGFNEIIDCSIRRAGYSIYNTGKNSTIARNVFDEADTYCLHLLADEGGVDNNEVYDNTFTRCGQLSTPSSNAAVIASGAGNQFYRNLMYNNGQGGLQINNSCFPDCAVYNNTIVNNAGAALNFGTNISPGHVQIIRNNILQNNGGGPASWDGSLNLGTNSSNNICNSVQAQVCQTVATVDFTNPGAGDFTLASSSTQAINTGTTQIRGTSGGACPSSNTSGANIVLTGFQGFCPDLGAFEFGGVGPPPVNSLPIVSIQVPTTAATFSATSTPVNISGIASDSDGTVNKVTWTCSRCGPLNSSGLGTSNSGTATGTTGWSIGAQPLRAGLNGFIITATDNAGGISTDTLSITYTPTPATPALVAAYSFDAGSGSTAEDSSGNANTGSLQNVPTWTTQGRFGNALVFDGVNDYVLIPDSNSLDVVEGFAISAWVNPAIAQNDFRAVFTKGLAGRLYATGEGFCGTSGVMGFLETNGISGPPFSVCRIPAIASNQWSHLAITYDNSNFRLYVNGVLSQTTPASGLLEPNTEVGRVAASQYGEFFQGVIDEFRFYNRAIPGSAGANTSPGVACGYTSQDDRANMSLVSIIGDMNCPVIHAAPPAVIKIPASASALKLSGTVKFGSAP